MTVDVGAARLELDPHADAVFFDMDGTLVDWETGLDASWGTVCDNACGDVPGLRADALLAAIQTKRDWFWNDAKLSASGRMDLFGSTQRIVQLALDALECNAPGLALRIASDYRALREDSLALYPGAIETLRVLRMHGIATALITNGAAEVQRRTVERFALAPYFDCIVIEGEFGCGKPDERVFRHALKTVGCRPAAAWMIGDNLEADIATPRRLGMHTVWIEGPNRALRALPSDAQPHRTIGSIAELLP